MTSDELTVLAAGRRMGTLVRHRQRDMLRFDYDPAWVASAAAFPLSLSMPLAANSHPDAVVEAFLWGLLPDNDGVLRRWGETFGVSPRHAFKLIAHVGEDCAGAVQFVLPERAEVLLTASRPGRVHWLDDAEVTERMQLLVRDHSASRIGTDLGRFSLAGAQPKTALFHDPGRDRWGIPSGATPTTHILKPATGQFDGYAENEHFCASLARAVGLSAAASTIRHFGDIAVFVTERYDRIRRGARVLRVHQEDACQAMARLPHAKYQNEGGPSAAEVMALIRQHSSAREEDATRFVDALLFNWLILGTDAHAKNYSFLIGANRTVRLAPLYDLASALPYPRQVPKQRATLAMKIGGEYRDRAIGSAHWRKAAVELRWATDGMRERLTGLAERMLDAAADVHRRMREQGIQHAAIGRLRTALAERVAKAKVLAEAIR